MLKFYGELMKVALGFILAFALAAGLLALVTSSHIILNILGWVVVAAIGYLLVTIIKVIRS